MRIAGQFETEKKWCIKLVAKSPNVYLAAVDENTEDLISEIIRFDISGNVNKSIGLKESLWDAGYDPLEHNNRFDEAGRIIID